jgi:archaellum component FlaC
MSNKKGDFKAMFRDIAKVISNFKGDTTTEQKFGQSVLADGTKLEWEGDEPKPGVPIMAMTPEGTLAPAPDGEYVLPETNTTVKVEGGVIASAVPAQATPEPTNPAANEGMGSAAPVAPTAKEIVERVEKVSKFMEEFEQKFTAMEKNISGLSEELANVKKENEALKEKNESISKFASDLQKTIEEFGEQPQENTELPENFRNETPAKEDITSKLTFR